MKDTPGDIHSNKEMEHLLPRFEYTEAGQQLLWEAGSNEEWDKFFHDTRIVVDDKIVAHTLVQVWCCKRRIQFQWLIAKNK